MKHHHLIVRSFWIAFIIETLFVALFVEPVRF